MPLVMVTGDDEGEATPVVVVAGLVWSAKSPSGGGDTVVVGACWPTGAVSWPRMLHVYTGAEHRCVTSAHAMSTLPLESPGVQECPSSRHR